MADDGQSAFAEPMTMQEALDKAGSLTETKPVEVEEAPQEAAEEQAEELKAETPEAAEEVTEPEPEQADDGPQVLTIEEYGDVLVDVNGEATSLSDLQKGTLRQADYSRKTQALAQERKELEATLSERQAALEAREQQVNERLSQLDNEPDWVKLAEDDPLGYASERAKWDVKQAEAQKANAELSAKQEKAVREFSRVTAEKAISVFPEWADAGKFDEGSEARKRAALDAGFTEAEYSQAHDFRLAALLEKAARFDAMSKDTTSKLVAAEKRVAKAPKVLKPGQSRGPVDPKTERRSAISKQFSGPISSTDIRKMIGR